MLRWTVGLDDPRIMTSAAILTFLIGAASFHIVEQPVRRMRPFITRPHWQTVAVGLATLTLCFIATNTLYSRTQRLSLSVVKNAEIWSPYFVPTALSENCNVKVTYKEGEQYLVDLVSLIPSECRSEHAADRRLFVIGDSHAGAYRRMLLDLAREKGVEIWIYETRCSIANLNRPQKSECLQTASNALDVAKAKGKPNDIIFLASLRMDRLATQWDTVNGLDLLERQTSGEARRDRAAALDEASKYTGQIQRLGFRVLLGAPLPVVPSPAFRCSDWFNRMNPICYRGKTVSRRFVEESRQNGMRSISILSGEFPTLSIWDPFDRLCPGEQCSSWDDEGPLFFDGDHLTGHANQILYPSFRQRVDEIWGRFATSAIAQ
jgi:hypothetical protein